jgi:hypothetical protein
MQETHEKRQNIEIENGMRSRKSDAWSPSTSFEAETSLIN